MTRKNMYAMYFASIYSMQWHPGAGTRGHEPLTLAQCDTIVKNMLERTYITYDQWKEEDKCRGSDQP